jgi:enamine deaminase RidA (YjgF/YER057c/UK114 family)
MIMQRACRIWLEHMGSSLDDAVKLNRWYVGHGTVADWRPAALACADYFRESGPAATGMPVPTLGSPGQQIMIEVVAMRGEHGQRLPRRNSWPASLWDWPLHLPYKHGLKCAEMIFLGGQVSLDKSGEVVNAGDLFAQADVAMTHIGTILRDLGADYRDICKLTMMYESDCSPERLAGLSSVCSSFFTGQHPTATAIPLPTLSYPEMVVEIDTFAMIEPALESR